MIYLSLRRQQVRIGPRKNRYCEKGTVFISYSVIDVNPYVKKIKTGAVKAEDIQNPKVLSKSKDSANILIQAETDKYGVVAFYLITLREGECTLAPIPIPEAKQFFNNCLEKDRKQQRFSKLLPDDASGYQSSTFLQDPWVALADDEDRAREAAMSRSKLQNDCMPMLGDAHELWKNHRARYPGLTESSFNPKGELL